jgi:hypothetical protein
VTAPAELAAARRGKDVQGAAYFVAAKHR